MQELITPGLPVEIPWGLVQYEILFWSTVVVILTALLGWWLGRRLRKYPGRRQVAAELFVTFWDGLCRDLLGQRRGRKYLALFGSLFLFVAMCNVIGLVPLHGLTLGLFPKRGLEIGGDPYRDFNDDGAWQPGEPAVGESGETAWAKPRTDDDPEGRARYRTCGFLIPPAQEPTRNVNVPVGLSVLLTIGMYGAVVILKGGRGLLKAFTEPLWFMLPLNLIGAVSQVVSVSMRLFGNMFGGAIIMIILGGLLYHICLPVVMSAFLGLFVGIIQAFVFTMLWLTYHADVLAEEG